MLIEINDFDLTLLKDLFVSDKYYTKSMILSELLEWQKEPDFLCLINYEKGLGSKINGFLIAHRVRNTFWIHQCFNRDRFDLKFTKQSIECIKKWAKDRGMETITFETNRFKEKAWKRLGFKEYTVNYMLEL